ncbi:uncharacterized protein OCT59_025503 [Rhizophagus irregularis]|uniref:Uncharacterized protein n=2 Tax=Rhizophagus irregularis TaxID=588596 RepID=A0A015KCP6_RHIIW|nr:hypothetical protein GLOIN_2v1875534 [Rhizophagus irregularis DAOM 181602=DAOM 197198]EXX65264.1 hypothetical protein RirG_134910 [Rhizophagus irregularis DAOM 197198w]UZO05143.1 hypothetical protein OCT59_025503 [Rhizophagus irregularis]POG71958.1 hypothetical protein GLOIN_2v1875534 [Rhizophagus irregularis DAOM 181602=DAOM 197198]CAG8577741.1 9441_t:CDS:2 [Rhizophagus irregularis]GBC11392.1 hypothetical protein GLOIN_2v1875534 [Rhizophagus irregularis DAOM 181602=DAOM 197198]|eukprot:XP_025178824.1 hypothetical protein GLOIN_2v1875534 [Rhizophagus irregularis DAOM 181602=DAOM 197198]
MNLSDYIRSIFFKVNINNERQRTFVLNLCTKFLSSDTRSFGIQSNDLSRFEIDELYKLVFRSNDVKMYFSPNSFITFNIIQYSLASILPICKVWFQPYVESLRRLDKEKRREWNQNSNMNNQVDNMKNDLINNIGQILPGFNYLIDFNWDVYENHRHHEVGDLVFGSDYGVIIVIETKWFNTDTLSKAQVNARKKARNRVRKYRGYAQEKFIAVKAIGAVFTNDTGNSIQFVDDQDAGIAKIIEIHTQYLYNFDREEWEESPEKRGILKTILYYIIIVLLVIVAVIVGLAILTVP